MKEAVIALGSNMGDRAENLSQARLLIGGQVGEILRASSVIETEAWGFDAPPFLNQVVVVRTPLEPLPLLDTLQRIERDLGRTEKTTYTDGVPSYHDRTIDLDILDYDGMVYQDDRLTLPHPRIAEREFVLASLRELDINITDNESTL